jgi:uncharacterized protein
MIYYFERTEVGSFFCCIKFSMFLGMFMSNLVGLEQNKFCEKSLILSKEAKDLVIQKTVDFVKEKLSGEGSGHDWWHVKRVFDLSKRIGQEENVDIFVVSLAALLHDIADWKFHGGDEDVGPKVARGFLEGLSVDPDVICKVCDIIKGISFKGGKVAQVPLSREGMVVQDADRLDAMGAVGVARAFAFGGHKNQEMYDPAIKLEEHDTFEKYKNRKTTVINHFYEKLLLLKDRMNTSTGKMLAQGRHEFMQTFLDQFFKEASGER